MKLNLIRVRAGCSPHSNDVAIDALDEYCPCFRTPKGEIMWWGIGFGGVFLYLLVLFTLGMVTIRNGHGWLFFFGIFFPLLWLVGALMPRANPQLG
jgi:hypothetical protein